MSETVQVSDSWCGPNLCGAVQGDHRVENGPVCFVLPERRKPVQGPAWQQNLR